MKKIKLARVVTIPFVFSHMLHLLKELNDSNFFEVHLICDKGDLLDDLVLNYPNLKFHYLHISRDISLKEDLKAVIGLHKIFKKEKFDIIHSHTPKAGLVAALAAFLARTPVRIHTFTGQVWATKKGIMREVLKLIDSLIILLNTTCYVDSPSQKKFLISEKIAKASGLKILGKGSFGGINTNRFNRSLLLDKILFKRDEVFGDYSGIVLLYLGRMNSEKGLKELNDAFSSLCKEYEIRLLLVGPKDAVVNSDFDHFFNNMIKNKNIVYIPFTNQPEIFLGIADIFCFPSYREGFGTVALEAASMELPVVASNIYGLSDAVEDNYSGLLFKARDSLDLRLKLEQLIKNRDLRLKLGKQGRKRAEEYFDDKLLTNAMITDYKNLIKDKLRYL